MHPGARGRHSFLIDGARTSKTKAGEFCVSMRGNTTMPQTPLLSFIAEVREQIEKYRPKTAKAKAAVRTLPVALGKQLAPS